jgi:hypothetical protein
MSNILPDSIILPLADLQARVSFNLLTTEVTDRRFEALLEELSEEVNIALKKTLTWKARAEDINLYNRVRDIQKVLHLVHLEKTAVSLASNISRILRGGGRTSEVDLSVFIGGMISALKSDENLLDGFMYLMPSFYGLKADGINPLVDDELRPHAHAMFLRLMDKEELSVQDVKVHYRQYIAGSITQSLMEYAPILPHLKLIIDRDTDYINKIDELRRKQSKIDEENRVRLLEEEAHATAFQENELKEHIIIFLVVIIFLVGWFLLMGSIAIVTIYVPFFAGIWAAGFVVKFLENWRK